MSKSDKEGRSPATKEKQAKDPELFFGLVSPIGVGGGAVSDSLRAALEDVDYQLCTIRVIEELKHVGAIHPELEEESPFGKIPKKPEEERYIKSIEAGNRFCETFGEIGEVASNGKGQDALVALAIAAIANFRKSAWLDILKKGSVVAPSFSEHDAYEFQPLKRQSYLFRSLKRPGEVSRLRKIYGSGFFLISAHAPREHRIKTLARKLAASDLQYDPDAARESAEKLLRLDLEDKENPAGQNVRQAFAKADFFVDASGSRAELREQLRRFVAILFGFQFHTPTKDEYGMAMAHLASLRSSHFSRQVGAAIAKEDGSIVATGCNEVPRAGGGLYWPGDKDDQRDFQLRKNTSLDVRYEVLGDTLQRYLRRLGKEMDLSGEDIQRLHERFIELTPQDPKLASSRIMDAIEYDRSVHAEMTAITDAARHGINIKECTLYTTTFPCHNCARHIVSSGIRRVVYIHPYEKSLTKRLHGDAIGVDLAPSTEQGAVRFDPFVGVSPNLYIELFSMGERRGRGKRWRSIAKWHPKEAQPRLSFEELLYTRGEESAQDWLLAQFEENKFVYARKEPQ